VLAESEVINSALWFFLGTLSYRFISSLIFSARSLLIIEETIIHCLCLVKYSDKSYEAALDLKENIYKSNKTSEELFKEREADKLLRDTWRDMVILAIISSCPHTLRGAVKFSDWDSAMKYLRKFQKDIK